MQPDLTYTQQVERSSLINSFFLQVYGWMFFGLVTTGIVAYYIANSPALLSYIYSNGFVFFGLFIVQLLLVIAISGAVNALSAGMASFLFFIYSALNGATLSSLLFLYTDESIALAFFVTAGTFGAMSAYGYLTKTDLSKLGSVLFMGLIGLIIATLVNLFLRSEGLMWILTYAGVLIFVGLTAADTQRLKRLAYQITDENMVGRVAVIGALTLYLDFVNMFLYFLRIFGRQRN